MKGREGKIFTKDGLISHHAALPRLARRSKLRHHPAHRCRPDDRRSNGPKGDYTLFVDISDPEHWTLIVNKKTGEWGLAYDGSQDLGKTKMHMSKPPSMVENLQYTIKDNGGGKGHHHAGLGRSRSRPCPSPCTNSQRTESHGGARISEKASALPLQ